MNRLRCISFWATVAISCLALTLQPTGPLQAQSDEAKRKAHAPNLTVEVHKRTFPVGKKAYVRVSLYNLKQASLAAYAVDIETLVPNARTVTISDKKDEGGLPYRLKHLDLSGRRPVRTWTVRLKKTYPDSWRDHDTVLPWLRAGVYVITAKGGGVEQRTWLAISSRALLAKRSPEKIFGWLVNVETGQPVVGVPVGVYNTKGRVAVVKTERDGRFRYAVSSPTEPYWLATRSGPPAFVQPAPPGKEQRYKAYVYTDRPIYRPGHKVQFRGTVREVTRGRYSVPDSFDQVNVRIKTSGGSTVYDQDLPIPGDFATFFGDFQLAPEPPLGRYELITTVGTGEDKSYFYTDFEVEAYRKPEFEVKIDIPKAYYSSGSTIPVTISADYFFGSPVSGGKVSYEVDFHESGSRVPERVLTAAGLGSAAALSIEDHFTGEGRLDKDGKLVVEVETRHVPVDRVMRVSAEVSELALRPREAEASTLITAAQFRLSIRPESGQYYVGDSVVVLVKTDDYDGKPVSGEVEVTLIETKQDREGRYYEEKHTRKVTTDENGKARVPYDVTRPGRYKLEAWAIDDEGNAVYNETSFRMQGKEEKERQWPALRLKADKSSYRPGDIALVRGETNMLGAWMLVTIEGEFLYDATVHRLLANEFTLRIPIKESHKPAVRVKASVIRRGDRTGASARLNVPHDEMRLKVIVSPDKEVYEPGEAASYTITTRDYRDRAALSEVGLAVVDEALYEIREDDTPNPYNVFWDRRPLRVTTDFSMAEMYPGGTAQGEPAMFGALAPRASMARPPAVPYAGEEAAAEEVRVRRKFADIAHWGPSIITDPDGTARISFEMPDNLTTWRATARALTKDAAGGEGRETATVTMPLLVRLVLPRFYVEGDEATAAAIVHNYTEQTREVTVTLTGEGVEVLGEPQQIISLAKEGIRRLTWRIKAIGPQNARFLVSAEGGPGAADAMESTLPVLPNGMKNVDAYAGVSDYEVSETLTLPDSALLDSATLEITISPSLAGPIFEALEYLARYPYGCAEQTLDSFLPNVVVARTLAQLKVDRPKPQNLDRYVSFGLQKLLRYQHGDGGWHWWEFDDSDPYMTAYIVYGLKIAQEAGYIGTDRAIRRGVAYLREALGEEKYRQAQAYLLWALAYADQWNEQSLEEAAQVAVNLVDEHEKLDVFSRASLALALHRLAQSEITQPAHDLLNEAAAALTGELDGMAIQTGLGAHWTADARYAYSWLDNDVEVTAQVLRALLEIRPDSKNIVPAVRWLMATRRGKSWRSTKDTAAAVLALSNYLEKSDELRPEYTAKIYVNGHEAKTVTMDAASIFADPVSIHVPAEGLVPGANLLQIDKKGTGTTYWSARLHYLIPAEQALPEAKGITVERTYRIPVQNPVEGGSQAPGSVVAVELRVAVAENMRYVLLEEPIPAGCEVIVGEERPWDNPWDRREVWDNRLVFFFDYLSKGDHFLSYVLRTEAPGQYNILPSTAMLMYFPEVRGHNRPVRMRIREIEVNDQ